MNPPFRPKVALFDLGKVLVHFDWSIAARNIAPRCNHAPRELLDKMMRSPLLPLYESGRVTSQEFFAAVREAIGYRGTFEDFADAFGAIFSEIPEMTAFQAQVRAAGLPTWVFSNTNDLAVQYVRRAFPFFANFDGYFLSYELGVMKPNAGIYEAAERATGCAGPEVLYIDDFMENVAAGTARGWQTILHVTPAQTIAQARRLLHLLSPRHGAA
jgi:glucose-1-phosphatase